MADFEITSNAENLGRELAAAARLAATRVKPALEESARLVMRHTQVAHLTGPTGATTLTPHSRHLTRSMNYRLEVDAGTPVAIVGPNVPYGALQHFGGTVRPKGHPYLTIPLKAALTASGPKFTAREIIANPGEGGYSGTFVATSKAGNRIIFGRLGRTEKGRQRTKKGAGGERFGYVPLFVLKRSVSVPGRPYLYTALAEKAAEIEIIFSRTMFGGPEFSGGG